MDIKYRHGAQNLSPSYLRPFLILPMPSSTQFLYQFTSVDILNTSLIDVHTGASTYQIVTSPDTPEGSSSKITQLSRSDETSAAGSDGELDGAEVPKRRTVIHDAAGDVVCEVAWNGRIPDITLGDEKVGPLKQLFGSTGVPFRYVSPFCLCLTTVSLNLQRHNALTIPSRFNADCVWTATPNSLVVSFSSEQRNSVILTASLALRS